MTATGDAPITIVADTSGFDEAMRDMAASAEQFGRVFSAAMSRAVVSGRDLDDTLRAIALRFADLALGRALSPLENAVSGLFANLAPALSNGASAAAAPTSPPRITFNVNSPDVAGFGKSQAQIAAMLARAVGRGQRGL